MSIAISGWFGFWIFLAAVLVYDYRCVRMGMDGILTGFTTPEEKRLQKILIDKHEREEKAER